MKTIKSKSN
nr:hypothetical protein [Tanacetum cinerariifolium]